MPSRSLSRGRTIVGPPIDRRTLNRTLLARQALLSRAPSTTEAMVEQLVGLQAQVPRDPYISLWSRIEGFEASALEALVLDRRVVRMTLMRTTLHLVMARDAVALRTALQPVCERGFAGSPFARRLGGADVPSILAVGTELLDEGPLGVAELGRALRRRWPHLDAEALGMTVRYLVPLVQVPPRGLLSRSSAPRFGTLRSWLGPEGGAISDDPGARAAATEAAILRYLRAFGPSTTADIRAWSWLQDVAVTLDRLGGRIRWVTDDRGRALADVADGELASPDLEAPVRFLGEYDNVFLSHADRTRVTGEIAWGTDYARRGTFFVDGFLAGPWERRGSSLVLEPRVPIAKPTRARVEDEGRRLVAWLSRGERGEADDVAAGAVELRWTD